MTQPPFTITATMLNQVAAIGESTRQTDSAPFIEFMLGMIQDALRASTPEVSPKLPPKSFGCLPCCRVKWGRRS